MVRKEFEAPPRLGRRAFLWALAAALAPVAACSLVGSRHRFELTVEVEIEGLRYTGRGVREVVSREVSAFPLSGTNVLADVKGEAFWIDVPGKPTLFVTLKEVEGGWSSDWMPGESISAPGDAAFKPVKISPDRAPALVYFENLNDRSTVKAIVGPNLSDRFGQNAKIIGVSVAKTRAPLSRGIMEKIPWMPDALKAYRRNSLVYSNPSEYIFNVTQFYRL